MSVEVVDPAMKPGKIRKMIGLLGKLILAAILVGGGFAGGYVYFAKPFSPAQDMLRLIEPEAAAQADAAATGEMPEKVAKEMPETDLFVTSYFTFPDALTSNLMNSKSFLQVQVGVSTQYDAQVITNVETHKLALQSDMLAVMATFTAEDLAGTAGRKRLADALKDAVNERLETLEGFGGVEDVFFPSFMMQ
ncbi:MAG: flagellar basal body-associated FliL family protein [Fuscovulum sp.]|jgi:flagellar FliL protein|nr:flagellar basal body-associated FliL family protein [Paracoccaceae bacterium]MCZ8084619.1 flagellar basal body-associated FliL family protein [Paracoccaceae bacterium]WRH62735.1 MAG: flagellar basal body-associated FliL family protein [Fuscovulum sp.]